MIGTVSTVDALVGALRSRVLNGELEPGSPLREIELSKAYEVGRHSLRAALQTLVLEGLLRHEPNRGVFVPRLSRDDVVDLFLVRTALEIEAARIVVRRRTDLAAAERAVRSFEALRRRSPWEEVVEIDLRFHRALIEATASPRMSRTFASLQAELRLLLAQLRPSYDDLDALAATHRAVLSAMQSGSSRRAASAVRAHLDDGVGEILAAISRPAGAPPAAPASARSAT